MLGIERLEPEVTLLAVTLDKSKSDTIGNSFESNFALAKFNI